MQSNVENPNILERNLDISISQENIQVEVNDRLKRLAGKVKVQGFRPGKVPLRIMAQQFGAKLHQEVLGEMLQKHFQEAVQQQKLMIKKLKKHCIFCRNREPNMNWFIDQQH